MTSPLGVGLLFNPSVSEFVTATDPPFDYLEIIPDRFWLDKGGEAGPRYREFESSRALLDYCAAHVPILCHSVGLSIGSATRFDEEHIHQIARWQRHYGFPWHSDHLSFSRLSEHGVEFDAALSLPLAWEEESLDLLAPRIRKVLETVPCPFLLENNVYFVIPPEQEMTEAEFLNELTHRTGCGLLLDLHNVYVNSVNHRFDPEEFLGKLDLERVVEIHIAGGDELAGFYTDSHAGAVAEPVWPLLDRVLAAAPSVRAVTFEFHESYFPRLGADGITRELNRAREIWEAHARV